MSCLAFSYAHMRILGQPMQDVAQRHKGLMPQQPGGFYKGPWAAVALLLAGRDGSI